MTKVINLFGEPTSHEPITTEKILEQAGERGYEYVIVIGVNEHGGTGLMTNFDDVETTHYHVSRVQKVLLDLEL